MAAAGAADPAGVEAAVGAVRAGAAAGVAAGVAVLAGVQATDGVQAGAGAYRARITPPITRRPLTTALRRAVTVRGHTPNLRRLPSRTNRLNNRSDLHREAAGIAAFLFFPVANVK